MLFTCFQHFPTEQCSKHFKTLCIQFYTLVIWLVIDRIPIVNYDHPQVLIVGIIVMGI